MTVIDRDNQLRELFDFMAEPNRGDSASARVLCEVVDEWLKVGRVRGLLQAARSA